MLPSAAIDGWIMRTLQEELPVEEVSSYAISDTGIFGRVLRWNNHINGFADIEIFILIDSENRNISWAVRDFSGDSFLKLKREHFNLNLEQAILRIPFKSGTKDILYNIDIFQNIMDDKWSEFLEIFEKHNK